MVVARFLHMVAFAICSLLNMRCYSCCCSCCLLCTIVEVAQSDIDRQTLALDICAIIVLGHLTDAHTATKGNRRESQREEQDA